MKNYKIIIVVIILLLVGGVSFYFINNFGKIIGNNTNTPTITEDTIYISNGGTYEVKGSVSNIYVDITDNEDVTLVLNNINIKTSEIPVYIENGNVTIKLEGKNYIEYTGNEENAAIYSKDNVTFEGTGSLEIASTYDGIKIKDDLVIKSGTYTITTGSGYKATSKSMDFNMKSDSTSSEESYKGIKATNITIENGTFNLDNEDDSIHANGNLIINNGEFTITSSDDGIHADGLLEINGGTINITASEGIEATYVKINNGDISINATDDGINAGNKSDDYKTVIEINGGNISIKMASGDTDGVDSNGDIIINGGTIEVTGQSTFDYDGTGIINGGTVICNGEKVTTLPNQFMGGGMMPGGMQPNNQNMQRRR